MGQTKLNQEQLLRNLESPEADLSVLRDIFSDPKDAFICSPRKLDFRMLESIYASEIITDPGDPAQQDELIKWRVRTRHRMQSERWMEQRAMYQSKRSEMRRDAIIEAETTVWAMLGLDFHMGHVRSLWSRWELMSEALEEALSKVANGERPFGNDLKDMAKELREVESRLIELMPKLGFGERAQRALMGKSGDRERALANIAERLDALGAVGVAQRVLIAVDGAGGAGGERPVKTDIVVGRGSFGEAFDAIGDAGEVGDGESEDDDHD